MAKSFPNTGATVIDSVADLPAASGALEGVMMFQKDTNELKICDGASWISMLDTDNPSGMDLIAAYNPSSSGTLNMTSIFSSKYENYRIVFNVRASADTLTLLYGNLLTGSTAVTSSYICGMRTFDPNAANTAWVDGNTSTSRVIMGHVGGTGGGGAGHIDIYSPNNAIRTHFVGHNSGLYPATWFSTSFYGGQNTNNTAYDGFQLTQSANTITGTVRVYGYRNSI